MAYYKILFWQDIPTQVKIYDDFDDVMVPLDDKFMVKVDRVAQKTGLTNSDAYLDQWNWSEEFEKEGEVEEVVAMIKAEVENKHK